MAHVCDYLQEKIRDFVSNKNESYRWFARQCGVDNTTIYRLSTGEQKNLSFLNAQKILTLLDPENAVTNLTSFYPDETREIFGNGPKVARDRANISELLSQNFSLFKVFVFVSASLNANAESVKNQFGLEGLGFLDTLLSIGAIKDENGSLIDAIEGTIYPSDAAGKRMATYTVEMTNLQSPGSHIANLRANLSPEGLYAWYDASVEYKKRLQAIASDMGGDIVAVASTISGPFVLGDSK